MARRLGAAADGLATETAGRQVEELFDDHGRRVYGLCRLLLHDPVEAEDAVQQTFLSAYRSILGGNAPREPGVWLSSIARNECRTRMRAHADDPVALTDLPEGGGDPEQVAGERAEIAELCEALAELPELQRETIVLREFYGLSYGEVARMSGLGAPAVKSLIFRARRRLRKRLAHLRRAPAALAIPLTLRDSLVQAVPGLGGGGEAAGAVAKVASVSLAAKLAATTATVALVGSIGGETGGVEPRGAKLLRADPPRELSARPASAPAQQAGKLVVQRSPSTVPQRTPAASPPGRARTAAAAAESEPAEAEVEDLAARGTERAEAESSEREERESEEHEDTEGE